ncbi:tetratricopeptide repeat protein [Gelidibacter maritimus]|uniref:Tetratricopeptide repeat protein n=1 Tax=Gelidibacter maritimus TaxID=2761487 RepID=A0A7W2M5M5_9FLAO|nr:tetratricopeptide repeat protein [Gelidibacter maritimus]MBA6153150.1 tetratricopeptide repeat protein [Gelidibacter maritimus]
MIKFCIFLIITLLTWSMQAQSMLLKRADSLYAHGNYSKAIETYKAYEQQDLVYEKMAKAYLALGNYDLALKNYDLALNAFPEDALIKYDYAKLLSRSKKLNDAAVLLSELVFLDYRNPNYHYELGLVFEKQGDSTAMNRFHSAYELDPTHQKAIYKLGRYFLAKRNHETSLRYINKGLESYANNVELINLKALNFYWKEDYIEASLWFEKLLDLGENSQFIHEKLSFCYAQQALYDKAIVHAKQALQFDPKNATNLYILGQLYEKIKDYAAAEKWISEALFIMDQPLNAEYTKLATVLNQQGKYKEAIAALQSAIKENPQDETAQFFLVRTKDEYYADRDSKIKVYEVFKDKFPKSIYTPFANMRLRELKDEKFMASE